MNVYFVSGYAQYKTDSAMRVDSTQLADTPEKAIEQVASRYNAPAWTLKLTAVSS